jgi:glycosyltransferase involved in cell wall biosynthesis
MTTPVAAAADVMLALVVGDDATARTRTIASLAAQTIEVRVLAPGEAVPAVPSTWLLLVTAGTELAPVACEHAAWFLAAHPGAGWVTGRSPGSPESAAPLASLLGWCVVRTVQARDALGDPLFTAAGHDARTAPQLVLALVLTLLRAGGRGGWLADRATVAMSAATAWSRLLADARALLERTGLAESALVDPTIGAPSVLPLQRLAACASPRPTVRRRPTSGRRILALLQGFPAGGYTAFNADVLPRLVARGHDVTTCTTEWWRFDWRRDEIEAVAPDVHHAPAVVPTALLPAYVEHLVESRGIDVLFTSHSYLAYRLLPRLRARFPRLAVVDYVHTEWFEAHMYGSYATMGAQWSDAIDAHVASSRALADAMVGEGAAPDRMHVAHIGIDTRAWDPLTVQRAEVRAALGAGPGTTVLLFAGRVSPEKRPLLAVEATAALRAEGHDVRLVVAGGGPLLDAVRDRIAACGLEGHASVLGQLDESTLRAVYAGADVFFAPSEIEGIARALYEAMAMGVVPVASDVGGQRELVVPGTGTLVPPRPGTVESYLSALRSWMDPAVRAPAARAARAHVTGAFDIRHTVLAVEEAMTAAVGARSARAAAPVAPALCDELAVLALETMRRHVVRVTGR